MIPLNHKDTEKNLIADKDHHCQTEVTIGTVESWYGCRDTVVNMKIICLSHRSLITLT